MRKSKAKEEGNGYSYCTPPDHCDLIREFLGGQIWLDPCWNPGSFTRPLWKYYLEAGQCGLSLGWHDGTFCNPGFSHSKPWLVKGAKEWEDKGFENVILCLSATNSTYYHENGFKKWKAVCYPSKRIAFYYNGEAAKGFSRDCCYGYNGDRYRQFNSKFSKIGEVLRLR